VFAQTDTATLVIKDKTKYSAAFLNKLKLFSYSTHYQLLDSLLIIGQLDTAYFPTDLPLDEPRRLTGHSNYISFELTISRINYSTIAYNLGLYKANKLSFSQKGHADISTGFFLGSETDEDDKTGVSYGSTEYSHQSTSCVLFIRIGKNEIGKLCGKVKRSCRDKNRNIPLDACPTLYER
jgi:hypothetical protein